jgi:hypothetical protein
MDVMELRRYTMAAVLLGGALLPGRLSAQVQVADTLGPDTVVYTPERGRVTFAHRKHGEKAECVACHHESKSEKPLESPRQKCSACHTEPATEPMKTSLKFAMHDSDNKTGTCFDCHNKEAEAGKEVPNRCADCHKREGGG